MSGLELPVFVYAQTVSPRRCAIIGGYVYRGTRFPALQGVYVYADLCSGEIFGLTQTVASGWESRLLAQSPASPTTFGEDVDGELYMADSAGNVYQLTVRP
jgi:hypothetical protein